MPYLSIETNQSINDAQKEALLTKASALVSKELGKAESYIMVSIAPTRPMMFAGKPESCAYLELKSIGLPESKTKSLSAALCALINGELGVETDRVYIEFSDEQRGMWGWNNSTF